jgi:hypothetical protein
MLEGLSIYLYDLLSMTLGSALTDGSALLMTFIMVDRLKDISLPLLHFMCMYCQCCSAGSHLPCSCNPEKVSLESDFERYIGTFEAAILLEFREY